MSEEWRQVPGFCDFEVSSLGRLRSPRWGGEPREGRVDKTTGYRRILLTNRARFYVHYLVVLAFVGPRPERHQVAHENGCRTDNRLENLSYKTCRGNNADKLRHGTYLCGERVPGHKLTKQDVEKMRQMRADGASFDALGKLFGVHPMHACRVVAGRRWAQRRAA